MPFEAFFYIAIYPVLPQPFTFAGVDRLSPLLSWCLPKLMFSAVLAAGSLDFIMATCP